MSKLPHTQIASAIILAVATGCPSADPEAKYDQFLKDSKEERDEAAGRKMDVSGALADISGTHLFALAATIEPSLPLQFIATVNFVSTPDGGTMSIDFQPLSLTPGMTTEPRLPVGDVLSLPESPVDAGGGFALDFGEVSVVGEANPITGSEIIATLAIEGAIQSEDLWCGSVTGGVSVPLVFDLVGSTFAAVRIDGTDPASLPMPVIGACPDDGGGETGTASDTDSPTGTATGG